MDRAEFLGAFAALAATPLPSPTPFPKWDECTTNPALPYNRPIELKMQVLDGPNLDLLQYRGRAVLLHIFATWCGPCNKEIPHIVEAASDYAARGLAIVGIDSREEDDTVRAFRKRYGITFPIAMDRYGGFVPALEVGRTENDSVLPVTLFIDPRGYLYCDLVGGKGRNELRYRIERFLDAAAAAGELSPPPMP